MTIATTASCVSRASGALARSPAFGEVRPACARAKSPRSAASKSLHLSTPCFRMSKRARWARSVRRCRTAPPPPAASVSALMMVASLPAVPTLGQYPPGPSIARVTDETCPTNAPSAARAPAPPYSFASGVRANQPPTILRSEARRPSCIAREKTGASPRARSAEREARAAHLELGKHRRARFDRFRQVGAGPWAHPRRRHRPRRRLVAGARLLARARRGRLSCVAVRALCWMSFSRPSARIVA